MYKNISTANTLEFLLLIKSQLDLEEVNENNSLFYFYGASLWNARLKFYKN